MWIVTQVSKRARKREKLSAVVCRQRESGIRIKQRLMKRRSAAHTICCRSSVGRAGVCTAAGDGSSPSGSTRSIVDMRWILLRKLSPVSSSSARHVEIAQLRFDSGRALYADVAQRTGHQPSKLGTRVRLPSSAPLRLGRSLSVIIGSRCHLNAARLS